MRERGNENENEIERERERKREGGRESVCVYVFVKRDYLAIMNIK